MKAWFHWSLWQLYLIFFWPSRFQREVDGEEPGQPRLSSRERAVYLLKMFPWTVLLLFLVKLAVGLSLEVNGVVASVVAGVLAGVVFGVANNLVEGMYVTIVFQSRL